MPRKKKEKLVHFDIDTLSKQPGQKEVPQPVTLGQTLRAKREKKKLSLEDVAKKLCIKDIYLKALEDGHYYAFPNRVYGIGFLRTYSKFLGLDSDLMVAEFHAETSDLKDAPLDMPIIEKHFALPSKKVLMIVAVVLLAILIIWFTLAALLTTDLFVKLPVHSGTQTSSETVVLDKDVPVVADETLFSDSVDQKSSESDISKNKKSDAAELSTTKTAFVAKKDVWVRLYNKETQKIIFDKVMKKGDSFAPESPLTALELTTGRAHLLELYKDGEKVKTFGQEKGLSLAEFAN